MKWAAILDVAITLLLVKGGRTFKMSCAFTVPPNQDNCGVKNIWLVSALDRKSTVKFAVDPEWLRKKETSSWRSLFLCNTDVVLNHINYSLSSSTMYLLVFSPFDSAAIVFHIEDSSIEGKLAFEKVCETIKARQGEAMWREVWKITETICYHSALITRNSHAFTQKHSWFFR